MYSLTDSSENVHLGLVESLGRRLVGVGAEHGFGPSVLGAEHVLIRGREGVLFLVVVFVVFCVGSLGRLHLRRVRLGGLILLGASGIPLRRCPLLRRLLFGSLTLSSSPPVPLRQRIEVVRGVFVLRLLRLLRLKETKSSEKLARKINYQADRMSFCIICLLKEHLDFSCMKDQLKEYL